MHTFYELYDTKNPDEEISYLKHTQVERNFTNQKNLEEKAISMVGYKMYKTFIKGYTEKQWGQKATELPLFIIERLSLCFTFDNNYFTDADQEIPIEDYNYLIDGMLEEIVAKNNTDLLKERNYWLNMAKKIIYTGSIDEFFDYCFGALEYRSLRFEHKLYKQQNVQSCAAINETDIEVPYTRSIEHKHFVFGEQPVSIVTREYPQVWEKGCEAFYLINDERNTKRYTIYIYT
jgi:UDP-galactopyranose mutase